MAFFRQIWTLTDKNLKIVFLRHPISTIIRALIFPIAFAAFLSFSQNLFVQPAYWGIGEPRPIRSLQESLAYSQGTGRNTIAFVNNGLTGGDIDRVIDSLSETVTAAGKTAVRLSNLVELGNECPSSLQGVTPCFGGVVFNSSPNEGRGGVWNYTLRGDGSFGSDIDARSDHNAGQVYVMPLQVAVDSAILSVEQGDAALPSTIDEYLFTAGTEEERQADVRRQFQSSLSNFMAVALIIVMIGVCYHMSGHMATEREAGMAELIDAMMPTKYRWQPQVARLVSHHLAFTILYLPGWVISAIVISPGVFTDSSMAILVFHFLLSGLAFASLSILGAAFFKKSQLSGVVGVIAYILLAILAQSLTSPNTAVVTALSLLFTPCNFVWFLTYVARFQKQEIPTDLLEPGPESPWDLPGIVLFVFLGIQIVVYPVLGAWVERVLHGTTTKGRTILRDQAADEAPHEAVRLDGFTKIYKPNIFRRMFSFISRPRDAVVAVDNLTLGAGRGQILALLGANGSGKSTTLDSIAGTTKLSSGNITIDGTGGLGIAPQKNVMWDDLTVEEHVRIFNRLKSPLNRASKQEIRDLVKSVDLGLKTRALSKTLSGGQKRKLQLGMMLTGGSAVCCVDEVSSGIDPLSRRKIWDILLAERGKRTIILTTHFLDEADLLADNIAILSKGSLRALGTSVELKDRLGAGYRIHVFNAREIKDSPDIKGVKKKVGFDVISYLASSSSLAAQVIRALESAGISDYKFSGPTIEDVFLQVAEEIKGAGATKPEGSQTPSTVEKSTTSAEDLVMDNQEEKGVQLVAGKPIGFFRQTAILLLKRAVVFKTNWFPYVAAFLIPVVAAALVSLYVTDQNLVGCNPPPDPDSNAEDYALIFSTLYTAGGPAAAFSPETLLRLYQPAFGPGPAGSLVESLQGHLVGSYPEFNSFIEANRRNVTPSGMWLGDSSSTPTIAYNADTGDVYSSVFGLNILNMLSSNTSIATTWSPFDSLWVPSTENSLNFLIYFGLAMSAMPGFFGLYPNMERRRNVRGLQYSNGVRSLPLWMSHIIFDFSIVLVAVGLVTVIFAVTSDVWFELEYLFIVLMLYGLTSILYSYVVSLYFNTQLSTYAVSAGIQALGFLIYLIAYMCIITYAPTTSLEQYQLISHFVISIFIPMGSVTRSLFICLNLFNNACDGEQLAPAPQSVVFYGGPIVYLVVQSLLLFAFLLWYDSGAGLTWLLRLTGRNGAKSDKTNDPEDQEEDVANEMNRVTSSTSAPGQEPSDEDGLRVIHLSKTFGKNTAVDNVTFGVQHSEVFALLGPNGAGKSTTISLIRGDIPPNFRGGGDVLVEGTSVSRHRAGARSHLGVCPQFDAIDSMTVLEHLRFYARIRGVPDIEHNVRNVLAAVGLEAFATRMAHALSGGNKRKLSLGIALMGNPSVVLLDEPSSGLDAAAKRIMWRTLGAVVPGRSILLTTHSMEEADALAGRAGILARRMLAMGSVDDLRRRFGDRLHVHLVSRSAPHSTDEEMEAMRAWVISRWPGAEIEGKTYHGQMRFSVPASAVLAATTETAAVSRETAPAAAPTPTLSAAASTPGLDGSSFATARSSISSVSSIATTTQQPRRGSAAADRAVSPIEDEDNNNNEGNAGSSSDSSATPTITNTAADNKNLDQAVTEASTGSSAAAVAGPSVNKNNNANTTGSAVGQLVVVLEEHKDRLGIEHYSATPTTLDQVFLTIVGRHNVQEEGYHREVRNPWWKWALTGKKYAPT